MRLLVPPIELAVRFGQHRTPTQLPVLTMITGLCPMGVGGADPVAGRGGSVCRVVAVD